MSSEQTPQPISSPSTPVRERFSLKGLRDARRSTRVEFGIVAAVLLIAGLKAAAPVLLPIATAAFLSIVNLPFSSWLQRRRWPAPLAISAVVLFDILMVGALVGASIAITAELRTALPFYIERFVVLSQEGMDFLRVRGVRIPEDTLVPTFELERLLSLATTAFGAVARSIGVSIFILILTTVILSEVAGLPDKLRVATRREDLDLGRWMHIVMDVQRYLAVKTVISLITGVFIGLTMWWLNIDFALLWGTLAFVLNFIPTVGSIVASVPAVIIAYLQYGPGAALAVAIVFFVINMLFGNIIEPMLVGQQMGLSVLGVLFSLLFWGWLWGIPGAFLSVPLTLAVKIALDSTESYRWISVLLSPRPKRFALPGRKSDEAAEAEKEGLPE